MADAWQGYLVENRFIAFLLLLFGPGTQSAGSPKKLVHSRRPCVLLNGKGVAKEINAIGGHGLKAFFSSASSKAILNTRIERPYSNFRRT